MNGRREVTLLVHHSGTVLEDSPYIDHSSTPNGFQALMKSDQAEAEPVKEKRIAQISADVVLMTSLGTCRATELNMNAVCSVLHVRSAIEDIDSPSTCPATPSLTSAEVDPA